MEPIIEAVSTAILKQELSAIGPVRTTRKGENEIYFINIHNAPNVVKEIGRLREITFRASGGGTGLSIDLDEFDTEEQCYEQLIVWSPEDEQIIGGYRFIRCQEAILSSGEINLSTAHYFRFSAKFINDYLPYTIELGRSWVQPDYQLSKNPKKGLYALDNIWDGLGAIAVKNPDIRYFFGKVTMYPSYDTYSRDFLLYFMHYYFPDKENLMEAYHPLEQQDRGEEFGKLLEGLDFKEGFKVLNTVIREHGEFVPPLVNIYMSLSPTMKTFGTAVNQDFGNVEETGILVTISDVYEEKKERHLKF